LTVILACGPGERDLRQAGDWLLFRPASARPSAEPDGRKMSLSPWPRASGMKCEQRKGKGKALEKWEREEIVP